MVYEVKNIIGGQPRGTKIVLSLPGYLGQNPVMRVPHSTENDLEMAILSAQKVKTDSHKKSLNVTQVKTILSDILYELRKDKELMETIIDMRGVPVKELYKSLALLDNWLNNEESNGIDVFLINKFGQEPDRKLSSSLPISPYGVVTAANMLEYFEPFVLFSQLLFGRVSKQAGNNLTLLIRPSQGDAILHKIVETLPKYGLEDFAQILTWNSEIDTSFFRPPLIKKFIEATQGGIFFGSTSTLDYVTQGVSTEIKSNYTLLGTGFPIAFVTDNAKNLEDVAHKVLESCYEGKGGRCTSLSNLFVDHKVYNKLVGHLENICRKLVKGDPKDLSTDLASFSYDTLENAQRIKDTLLSEKVKGEIYLEMHTMDVLLHLDVDPLAKIISIETNFPLLNVIPVNGIDDMIQYASLALAKSQADKFTYLAVFGNESDAKHLSSIPHHLLKHNTSLSFDLNCGEHCGKVFAYEVFHKR
ncbi:MAG: aldehyde dehydrogenase family protein [Candidatus Woesearchaeota archaeon]